MEKKQRWTWSLSDPNHCQRWASKCSPKDYHLHLPTQLKNLMQTLTCFAFTEAYTSRHSTSTVQWTWSDCLSQHFESNVWVISGNCSLTEPLSKYTLTFSSHLFFSHFLPIFKILQMCRTRLVYRKKIDTNSSSFNGHWIFVRKNRT